MFVARQHLPANAGRDGGCVSTTVFADGGVAAHPFGFGTAQLPFTGIGLHGHATGFRIFMDVDLDRRTTWEVPPGALLAL